ncbi:MAG TPA: SRPBCC family protein [Candidatus Limnocylindrales bacterium]
MAAQYHFLSEYVIRGDAELVWAALTDVRSWPRWWPWLKRVETLRDASADDGVGAIHRNTVRAPAGYGFVYDTEITSVDHLRRIDVDSRGDIAGRGRFLLQPRSDGTLYLAFAWLVATPKRWMSFLAPIARPAFGWNHDRMMRAFGVGLAAAAGAELVSTRNTAIPPGRPGFQVMPEPEG